LKYMMSLFRMSVEEGLRMYQSKHTHGQLSSTVTRPGAGRSGVRILAATKVYSLLHIVKIGSWAQPSSY
jgi:hypothetical protein